MTVHRGAIVSVSSGGGSGTPIVTGNPSTFAVKGTTAGTPGTGNFTPNAASSGFKAWSTVFTGWTGVVRFEDGSDWEHSFCYWNGTALTRSANQFYESSSGSALSLTSSATATLLMDLDTFAAQGGPVRSAVIGPGISGHTSLGLSWTNITSPAAVSLANTNYFTEQPRNQYTSATTANAATGISPSFSYFMTSSTAGRGGGMLGYKFGFTQLPTNPRLWAGGGQTAIGGATEPSAYVAHFVVVGFDSTDTNMQFITNDSSGSGTKTDTGIAIATSVWYQYVMWNDPGSLDWHQILVDQSNGAIFYKKSTSDVPTSGQGLQPHFRAMLTASTGTAFILHLGDIMTRAGR